MDRPDRDQREVEEQVHAGRDADDDRARGLPVGGGERGPERVAEHPERDDHGQQP